MPFREGAHRTELVHDVATGVLTPQFSLLRRSTHPPDLASGMWPARQRAPDEETAVKTTIRALTVAVAAAALATGTMTTVMPTASAAGLTSVNDCGTLAKKPTELVLSCADANSMLTEMTWSGWSNGRAKGAGAYEANDCTPTCAAGTFRTYPARVLLTKPKVQAGQRVFTKAVITFTGAKPGTQKKLRVTLQPYQQPTTPTPAPTQTAAPAPTQSAAPAPTQTAAPTPTQSAAPTPTPTPTATATAEAAQAPTVKLGALRRGSTGKLFVDIKASVPGTRAPKRGITSVTVYRPNEYNAELDYKASFVGEDTADQDEWTAVLTCDSSSRMKDTLRIVVVADNGQRTTIRAEQTLAGC